MTTIALAVPRKFHSSCVSRFECTLAVLKDSDGLGDTNKGFVLGFC